MKRETKRYGHFCMLARALELLDDRWMPLVVRDLLTGPRRFSDLELRLGGITAKTLSQRLTDLEANGLVTVDRAIGRRDVWYSLTPAGMDLSPALDELTAWGLRHLKRPPEVGEATHPEHLLTALRIVLERRATPKSAVAWKFDFGNEGSYGLTYNEAGWKLSDEAPETPNLTVVVSVKQFAGFLTTPPTNRSHLLEQMSLTGPASQRTLFVRMCAYFPFGLD
jgi:DNA-binding HxlR family transcriptional regulator